MMFGHKKQIKNGDKKKIHFISDGSERISFYFKYIRFYYEQDFRTQYKAGMSYHILA